MTIAAGYAWVNATSNLTNVNGYTVTWTLTLYHVSPAAVETSLGSTTIAHASQAVATYMRFIARLSLTKKSFAVGDTLRFSIDGAKAPTGGALAYYIYTDPASELTVTDSYTAATTGTDCTIDIPFKVDV
jgi:hypothetical protein